VSYQLVGGVNAHQGLRVANMRGLLASESRNHSAGPRRHIISKVNTLKLSAGAFYFEYIILIILLKKEIHPKFVIFIKVLKVHNWLALWKLKD